MAARGRTTWAALAVTVLSGCSAAVTPPAAHTAHTAKPIPQPTNAVLSPPLPPAPTRTVFGRTVRGRPLIALWSGSPHALRRILVVGVIHGDEAAGLPVAQAFARLPVAAGARVLVVPDLNPDGFALHSRQNAHGVDLNRNFPYRWQPIGHAGDQQYSGTTSLSEPESLAMAALIAHFRPTISIWFHQPVGVVDESGGAVAIERRFAHLLGEPLRRLARYRGSAASWQNLLLPGSSAFVVELPRHVGSALRGRALSALRDLER